MRKNFFLFLIIYFLLHLIIRVSISNSVEFDEAEQILFSQQLSLGYGSQPPLYEWIQSIFFSLFGLNIFSLALFKNMLFVLIYFFLYKSARIILKSDTYAILASSALLLTYTYGWQSMRQLTHAVLVLAVCSITFFLFLKLITTKQTKYYLFLGFAIGLGILSKYNYFLFIIPLLLAGFSLRELRKVLCDQRIFFLLIIPLLIIGPHFIWFATHLQQATLRLAETQMDTNKAKGLVDFALCLLALLGPLGVIFLIFFPGVFTKNKLLACEDNQYLHLLMRFFLFSVLATSLWVVIFRIVDFEERWLQPIFFLFPTYLFLRLKNQIISQKRIKVFTSAIIIVALITLVMIPVCVAFPEKFGYKRVHYPLAELSQEIRKEGFVRGLVLSPDTSVAADIKLQFKDSFVLTHRVYFDPPKDFEQVLLIWGDTWWYDVPSELKEILPRYKIKAERTDIAKKALYKYSKDKYYEIYLIVINRDN